MPKPAAPIAPELALAGETVPPELQCETSTAQVLTSAYETLMSQAKRPVSPTSSQEPPASARQRTSGDAMGVAGGEQPAGASSGDAMGVAGGTPEGAEPTEAMSVDVEGTASVAVGDAGVATTESQRQGLWDMSISADWTQ